MIITENTCIFNFFLFLLVTKIKALEKYSVQGAKILFGSLAYYYIVGSVVREAQRPAHRRRRNLLCSYKSRRFYHQTPNRQFPGPAQFQ